MSEALSELGGFIEAKRPDCVISWDVTHGELNIDVAPANLAAFVEFLRKEPTCKFSQLIDLTAVDYPERDKRFDVVYHLLSMHQNQRVRLRVSVREDEMVPSIVPVHAGANWFEREAWDLYGIYFSGHPDLRRLLTDYGFSGHPLRKDFPLTGFVEVRYSEEQKRVVYEPVKLTQDFRSFDFMSPWEGAQYVLPGDEKAEQEAKS